MAPRPGRGADSRLIVPYGCAAWREDRIAQGPDGRLQCTVPHVVIDRADGRPFRLQDGQYAIPEPLRGAPDEELRQIENDALARADPWSRPGAAFLRRYFAHVRRRIHEETEPLQDRLGTSGSLFDYRAFAFAAPRPLPRAWLPAGNRRIRADCAFWTGDSLLAVEIERRTTPDPGAELARLRAAGVAVVRCPPGTEIGELGLPPVFERFMDGAALPSGPFKARGLEAYAEPQISSSST